MSRTHSERRTLQTGRFGGTGSGSGFRARRAVLRHTLEDSTGGSLGGHLLGPAVGLAGPVFADPHFNGEGLGVLGAAFADHGVTRSRKLAGLSQLLECALEVGDGGLDVGARILVAGEWRIQHVRGDETADGFGATVQVEVDR